MAELTKRYIVMLMATEVPFDAMDPEGVFVLKPWKDPAALRALETYRDNCYPELARDLDAWIQAIKNGPTVRGGVGTRNEPYLKTVVSPAPVGPVRPATNRRPKARTTPRRGHRLVRKTARKRPKKRR